MAKENPLIELKINNVGGSLYRYAEENCTVAGIHLISDVKKGYISAKNEEDEDLLWRIHASQNIPMKTSQMLFQFLRKAKEGAYFVNEAAIKATFDRTPAEPQVTNAPALG